MELFSIYFTNVYKCKSFFIYKGDSQLGELADVSVEADPFTLFHIVEVKADP